MSKLLLGFQELKKSFKKIILLGLGFFVLFLIFILSLFYFIQKDLPKIYKLKDYKPPIITKIYSDNNTSFAEFYLEKRIVVSISEMPKYLPQAFIAAEDSRFYHHQGLDYKSIMRAFIKNMQAGKIVQGGSTITQQVAKTFFLTKKRQYSRKIKEAILAYRLNKYFSKDEILHLYLNQIYLGHYSYGVGAAAENYFGKKVSELTIGECAILASLPKAPNKYSPYRSMEKARIRQGYVLKRMLEDGYITRAEYDKAIKTKIILKPIQNLYKDTVPYFTEYIRKYIDNKKYVLTLPDGSTKIAIIYEDGLQIYTTVNLEMQNSATKSVNFGLKELDKRQGYRQPIASLNKKEMWHFLNTESEEIINKGDDLTGIITKIDDEKNQILVRFSEGKFGIIELKDMRWASIPNPDKPYYNRMIRKVSDAPLKEKDLIYIKIKSYDENEKIYKLSLEQKPIAQSALLCLEAGTGFVKAMVGGKEFEKSQFNRAIQAKRQPGSAFKPIIYAAALDKNYTAASMIIDSPIVFKDQDKLWKPRNYKETFFGPTLLREALAHSRNIVTVKIVMDIGMDYVIDYAKKLGIESKLDNNLSTALGSSVVSLFELSRAYSVFLNQGNLIEPIFITKVLDREGNVLEENKPVPKQVIEESTAYIMTSLLESVVKEGTGVRAKSLRKTVAAKTGTTDSLYDAWFIGYSPKYLTGVWTGFDNEFSLGEGETGARASLPIWLYFMQDILKNEPNEPFKVSKDVVFARIDAETGLLPSNSSKKIIEEVFKEGTIPTKQSSKKDAPIDNSELFKNVF